MKITIWLGLVVFLVGVTILVVYSMYPIFNPDVCVYVILTGIRAGIVMMAIGGTVLVITIGLERYKEWKKMKAEIREEDLRP